MMKFEAGDRVRIATPVRGGARLLATTGQTGVVERRLNAYASIVRLDAGDTVAVRDDEAEHI
ncbi:hypothetical protein tb265_39220 [Gemmatimonadetes bacterium T265]|nr:hypothetical protein tb265_39220 [Gemmatimonadetes bacterium T265]